MCYVSPVTYNSYSRALSLGDGHELYFFGCTNGCKVTRKYVSRRPLPVQCSRIYLGNKSFVSNKEAIPDVLKNKMGLCYENLGQSTMASKAYREAWKALLEERNHGTAGKPDILNGYGVEANRDETGTMLQQEKSALRVSFSAGQEKRHANKSMPTDDLEKSPSAAPLFGSPERQGVPAEWGKRSLRHVYR